MVKAWAAARRHGAGNVERIREMIAAYHGSGAAIGMPLYRSLLAEALIAEGRAEEAAAEMTLAIEHIAQFGERFFEPMAWHVKGLCLQAMAEPDTAAIEQCWEQAAQAAQRIGARLYQLKALTGLALLDGPSDRAAARRRRLEQLFGQFPEGTDSPVLRKAAAILRNAASSPAIAN
jgi:hypothetical protein